MPLPAERRIRIQKRMLQDLSRVMVEKTNDPRFKDLKITRIDLAPDGRSCKVLIMEPAESEATLEALKKAAGFFRSALAKSMNLKISPRLQFVVDAQAAALQELNDILSDLS